MQIYAVVPQLPGNTADAAPRERLRCSISLLPMTNAEPDKNIRLVLGILIAVSLVMVGTVIFLLKTEDSVCETDNRTLEALLEIRLEVVLGHLRLKENLAQAPKRTDSTDGVWMFWERADWYARALLEGGSNPKGTFKPLEDPALFSVVTRLRTQLNFLKETAVEVWNRRDLQNQTENYARINDRFNDLLRRVLYTTDLMETQVRTRMVQNIYRFKVAAFFLLVLSISLPVILGIWIARLVKIYERNRTTLLKRERRHKNVIDHAPLAFELRDPDKRLLMANSAWHSLWKTKISDTPIQPSNYFPEDWALQNALIRAFNGEVVSLEQWRPQSVNILKELRVKTVAYPVQEKNGRIFGVALIHEDITDKWKEGSDLKERRMSLERILSSAPVGVCVVWEQKIKWVNDYLCDLVRYRPEEILGKNPDMLYPWSDAQNKKKFDSSWNEKEMTARLRRKDGKLTSVKITSAVLNPANPEDGVVFIIMGFLEKKMGDSRFRLAAAQLEKKIAEMQTTIRTSAEELQNAQVTLKGFSGILEKDLKKNDMPRVLEDLGYIRAASEDIHRLLRRLLSLTGS